MEHRQRSKLLSSLDGNLYTWKDYLAGTELKHELRRIRQQRKADRSLKARQRKTDLEVHRRRRQAVKVLVAATAGQDIDALSSAIQQAEAAGVNPDSVERAARHRAALEAEARRRRAREQAESALDAVTREIEDVARASVAGRNVAGRDPPHLIEGLTRAIATAEANDVGEARLADSRKKLMAMRLRREKLDSLEVATKGSDDEKLRVAIEKALSAGLDGAQPLEAARAEANRRRTRREAAEQDFVVVCNGTRTKQSSSRRRRRLQIRSRRQHGGPTSNMVHTFPPLS